MTGFKSSNQRINEVSDRKQNLGDDDWEFAEEMLFSSDKKTEK